MQEVLSGKTAAEVCREHELQSGLICRWRKEYQENPGVAFAGKGVASNEESRNAVLERKIGQLYLENDFLKRINTVLQQKLGEIKKKERGEKNVVRTSQS